MEQKKSRDIRSVLPPHLQALIDFYEFYEQTSKQLKEIDNKLKSLENTLKNKDEVLMGMFHPNEKIREATVRDILKLSKRQLEYYKEQGLISPINKHNYYLVRDVITLRKYIEQNQK